MTDKYEIRIFFSEEDECFIAEIPELKGCTAFGNTYEEAFKEILVAMKGWIDIATKYNDDIPEPKKKKSLVLK